MHKIGQALKNSFQELLKKKEILQTFKITIFCILPTIILMKYVWPKDQNLMPISYYIIHLILLPLSGAFIAKPIIYFYKKFVSELKEKA